MKGPHGENKHGQMDRLGRYSFKSLSIITIMFYYHSMHVFLPFH